MPKCKICGARIEDGTAVCPSCGAKVADGTAGQNTIASTSMIKAVCPSCGAEVIGEHRFCDKCGANLKEAAGQSNPAPAPKERRCPSCGSILQANSAFCQDCGQELAARSNTKTEPAQQTFQAAKASSPAPATNSTGNTRKIRISLIPESLTEMTAYFDSVQDFCSSPEVQNMSGKPTLGVDGELTEGELDSIVDLVVQGRKVKAFNLSSCTNALKLKGEQFFTEELFERCAGLETVRLSDGKTLTQDSIKKAKPKKKRKGLLIAAIIIGGIVCVSAIKGIQNLLSPLVISDGFDSSILEIDSNGVLMGVKDRSIVSLELPSSVKKIGRLAFQDCASLTSITIPKSVTSIGEAAFLNCTSLASITIPNSVTSIGNGAFSTCISLKSIRIPKSITIIGLGTFAGCSSLKSVSIPASVTSIGEGAFASCTSLTNITIPDSVTSIDIAAFGDCKSLSRIILPNSITSIRQNTFNGCESLTNIDIPDSVTSIDESAFFSCTSLRNISIPDSVYYIRKGAFWGCSALTSIIIPESVTHIEDFAFAYCTSLTSVSIPQSLTSIGKDIFAECTSITSIRLPDSPKDAKIIPIARDLTFICPKDSDTELLFRQMARRLFQSFKTNEWNINSQLEAIEWYADGDYNLRIIRKE